MFTKSSVQCLKKIKKIFLYYINSETAVKQDNFFKQEIRISIKSSSNNAL